MTRSWQLTVESTEGFSLLDAVERMRGPVGSQVSVSVLHRGQETPTQITLTRARIRVESVRGDAREVNGQWSFVLQQDPRIGYIRLTSFGDHTTEDLQRVLESLAGKVDGLIMDLRGNAGGLLNAAVEVCDMFIPRGPADRQHARTRSQAAQGLRVDRVGAGRQPLAHRRACRSILGQRQRDLRRLPAGLPAGGDRGRAHLGQGHGAERD